MRTEIMVPFAFDTTPIENMLQEHGEEEAMKILERLVKENVISQIPKQTDYYGRKQAEPDWNVYADRMFANYLNEHMDEIIDEAALLLAMRASRKGKWRDVLKELKEESNAD